MLFYYTLLVYDLAFTTAEPIVGNGGKATLAYSQYAIGYLLTDEGETNVLSTY